MRSALITDFDGTITEHDFFELIEQRYMPADHPDFFAEYRAGRISHAAAMQGFFEFAPDDDENLEQLMRDTEPDEGLAAAIGDLDSGGWDVIVVSAGSSWYIDRIFAKLGIANVEVISHEGRIVKGRGLQLDDLTRTIDKAGVVRKALGTYHRVAFAGDGPPDLRPALLVQPELRFARRFLAEELTRLGQGFRPFHRWTDVSAAVLATA